MMRKMLNKLKVRLRNKAVLVALVSGVTFLLTTLGVIDIPKANHIGDVINSVLVILVSLGIVSDPESHVKDEV